MSDDPKPALVALRDRREEVIRVLSDGYANDLLDVDQFEQRLERAHAATELATLEALIADLAVPTTTTALVVQPKPTLVVADKQPLKKRVRALFSNIERRGVWAVPSELGVTAIFGNAELDLREATMSPGVTELRVRAVFGNLEIIVPPELAVECDGTAVFANFEHHGQATVADPERPLLRVVGSAVFGNVEVKVRLRGEDPHRLQKKGLNPGRQDAKLEAKRSPALAPPKAAQPDD